MKSLVCILLSCLCLISISFAQNKEETETLHFDQVVEKELAPQKYHSYKIRLEAGQFAKFEATQFGSDVVFMMVASDGSNLIDIRNDVTGEGVEKTWVAVANSDDYELKVISFGKNTGKYSLRFSELRPATSKEIDFTNGHILFNQAFNLNTLFVDTETLTKSIAKYEEAAVKFRSADAISDYSSAMGNISNIYNRLGNRQKSVDYAAKRVEISRQTSDKIGLANGLNSLGAALLSLGRWQEALDAFSESLPLRRETKNRRGEGMTLNNIGQVYDRIGDFERAESYQLQALSIFKEIDDIDGQAVTLNNLGRNLFIKKDFEKALKLFEEAVKLGATLRNQKSQTVYLNNLGRTFFEKGEVEKSLEVLKQALSLNQKSQDKLNEAASLRYLGGIYLQQNDLTNAESNLTNSLKIYRQIEDPLNLAETLFAFANLNRKQGKLNEAQKFLEEALQIIESFRSGIKLNELRDSISGQLNDYYSLNTEILMQQHEIAPNQNFEKSAWLATERGRARNLLNLLNEANANINQGVSPDLLKKERETYQLLNARLENLTRVLSGKNTPKQIETLKREVEDIKLSYQLIQSKIRETSPRYANLTQPQPVSIEEVQQKLLSPDSAMISYSLGSEKSFLWLITKEKSQVFELPKREIIETKARKYYELLTARNIKIKFETPEEKRTRIANADGEILKIQEEISRILLGKIANFISNKKLIIVSEGALQFIPFASLKLNNRYLIETNEIINLPSASTLAILQREKANRKPAPKTVAVLADPVFEVTDERFTFAKVKMTDSTVATRSGDISDLNRSITDFGDAELSLRRLPFTRKEAETIAKLVPANQSKIALDFSATRQLALSEELNQYRILHFATHGFLNSKNPELSGLVFSLVDATGKLQNGFMRTDEVFNLKISADLVVLSACKTGLGKDIRGEGLIGMTRGFMYAGASRVMVSFWDVNDEATAGLMTQFYQKHLTNKMNYSKALRESQLAFLKDKKRSHPYFWAAFTLHGE